jgi:hypothetical protein
MRKYLLILLPLLFSALPAWSMNLRADSYFNELPMAPRHPCSQNREIREKFNNQVSGIAERLDEDIRERERVIKDAKRRDSKKMQEAVMDQPGFQGVDEETMKRMSREQRKKKAEQLMEQKYGVSMEEIDNLKQMKKEGKIKGVIGWGNAFTAEQQATAAMDPEKAAKTQQKNMETAHLAGEQADLAMKLAEHTGKYDKKNLELADDPQGKQFFELVKSRENDLAARQKEYPPCKTIESMEKEINAAKKTYCNHMSTNYIEILDGLHVSIVEDMGNYDKLDQLQAQIQEIQFGVKPIYEQEGLAALKAVRSYIHQLKKVYQYDLGITLPEDERDRCSGQLGM